MALRPLLSLILCASAWAAQSLITTGTSGTFTAPNTATFNSVSQLRVEARITNWAACSSNFGEVVRFGATNRFQFRYAICGNNDLVWVDGANNFAVGINMATLGYTDVTLRMQWTQGGQMVIQACPTTGGSFTTDSRAEGYGAAQDISGAGLMPQSGVGTMRLAWMRVYNTTVPTTTACPKNYVTGTPIIDWEFEGNGNDSSANGVNISFSGATYATTPTYAPVAVSSLVGLPSWAGTWGTVRAGKPFQVTGADSLTFADTATITCQWAQTAGPTTLTGLTNTTCTPALDGSTFGEYTLQLTVTDANGESSTPVSYSFGAVPTTDAGIVVHDATYAKVFGQQLRWGLSPWGQDDADQKILADSFGPSIPAAEWDVAAAGTITLTNGSLTVTGSGTSFQTLYCGGGTTPTSALMVARVSPTYRLLPIASCDSQTQITLISGYQWPFVTAAGAEHAVITNAAAWVGGSDNANYYDNVMAYYGLYYRTGRTAYKTYAETLADRWWTNPIIAGQRSSVAGCMYPCNQNPASRIKAFAGLMWRAAHGQSGWWPEMRTALDRTDITVNTALVDPREDAYEVAFQAIAGILDPDSGERTQWQSNVTAAITNRWAPRQDATSKQWLVNYRFYGDSSYNTPLAVVNGSCTVTANPRGNVNWTATLNDQFAVDGEAQGYAVASNYTGGSNGTFTISPCYTGTTRTIATGAYSLGTLAGEGSQPFVSQLVASAWRLAYEATGSATADQYVREIADWVRTAGIRTTTNGLFYGRIFPACEPEATAEASPTACKVAGAASPSLASTKEADRYLSMEGFSFSRAYISGGVANIKTAGDLLYGAVFGQYGGPSTDAVYVNLNDTKWKTFGFAYGFGGGAVTWPASRDGAVTPSNTRTLYVGASLAGASTMILRLTLADGTVVDSASCVSGACSVSADLRLGGAVMQIVRDGTPGPYQPLAL